MEEEEEEEDKAEEPVSNLRDELQDFDGNEEIDLKEAYDSCKLASAYMNPTKYPSEFENVMESREQAKKIMSKFNETLLKAIMENEEAIQNLRKEHPDSENQEFTPSNFAISKTTLQTCMEFLKENEVEIDSWIESLDECEKLKKILKIFFTLCSTYNKEEWCMFPHIIDDATFFAGAKQALLNDAALLGKRFGFS